MSECEHSWTPVRLYMGVYLCTRCGLYGHRMRDGFRDRHEIVPYAKGWRPGASAQSWAPSLKRAIGYPGDGGIDLGNRKAFDASREPPLQELSRRWRTPRG